MSAHIISEEQDEGGSPCACAYIMDGSLCVDIDADDFYEFGAPVNYCPMCGRRLGGDAS